MTSSCLSGVAAIRYPIRVIRAMAGAIASLQSRGAWWLIWVTKRCSTTAAARACTRVSATTTATGVAQGPHAVLAQDRLVLDDVFQAVGVLDVRGGQGADHAGHGLGRRAVDGFDRRIEMRATHHGILGGDDLGVIGTARHRLRRRPCLISSSVGSGLRSKSALAAMIMPGVQ